MLDPESIGASQVTVARPGPLTATTFCGGEGATPFPVGTYSKKLGDPSSNKLVSESFSFNLLALTDANVIV